MAPSFELETQQQTLEAVDKMALMADESFRRSKHVLIIGVSQWTTEESASQNSLQTDTMLQHIIGIRTKAHTMYQNISMGSDPNGGHHHIHMYLSGMTPKSV